MNKREQIYMNTLLLLLLFLLVTLWGLAIIGGLCVNALTEATLAYKPSPTPIVVNVTAPTPSPVPPLVTETTPPAIELPSRSEVERSPKEIIQEYVYTICAKYPNVDPTIILGMIKFESDFTTRATTGSHLGLMQVSTKWHKDRAERLGVTDFYSPYGNILLGVDYLSELITLHGDIELALMCYNMDHDKAKAIHARGENTKYVRDILEYARACKEGG